MSELPTFVTGDCLKRAKMRFYLVLLIACCSAAAEADSNLTFCYDPYPPFAIGNEGEYTEQGLKVALAKAVAKKIDGVEIRVRLYPWKRCQELARRGEVDGILPLFKTPEREKFLLYCDASWQQKSTFWFNRRSFPGGLSWSSFDDVSQLRLGMLRGGFINKTWKWPLRPKPLSTGLAA